MNREQFLQALEQAGYPEPVMVRQPPNGHLDDHTHPFSVQALVLDGYIAIHIDGDTKRYEAGDVFQLGYEQVHAETYGPEGVQYLASRKNHP